MANSRPETGGFFIFAISIHLCMNQLSTADRARIIHLLVEGNSIRATCRITGKSKNTVKKLIADAGRACHAYQDRTFLKLTCCKRIQCDEIWSFIASKEKNTSAEKKAAGSGDCWTWTALCADTKLILDWYVGNRDATAAYHFMTSLSRRLVTRVQLTTDGHRPYLQAVEDAFGTNIDYAMLIKLYGPGGPDTRYSPPTCIGAKKVPIMGKPDRKHISTSFVERQNLTIRMQMRRFTRLTNAFSKKVEYHGHALAIFFMFYNFARIHQTLRVTPAMEAGLADHVWEIEEIVGLIDTYHERPWVWDGTLNRVTS